MLLGCLEHVLGAHVRDPLAVGPPVVLLALREFVVRERARDLARGREEAREDLDQIGLGGVEFLRRHLVGAHALDLLDHDGRGLRAGRVAGLEAGPERARVVGARLEPRERAVGQAFVRTDPQHDAGGESAAAQDRIHDPHADRVGVRAFDAEVPQRDMRLVHVAAGLGDHIDAGLGFMGRSRDRGRLARVRGPAVGQAFVQPPEQVVRVEVPGRRDEEPLRVVVRLVEGQHALARDRLERGLRRLDRREVVAAQQAGELPGQDVSEAVVAARQALQAPGPGDFQALGIEPRVPEHVEEQVERRVQISRQAVARGAGGRAADARPELGRQKGRLLVEIPRAPGCGASGAHLAAGEGRQAGARGGQRVRSRSQGDRNRHERELVVLDQVRDRARIEFVPVLVRIGRLEGNFGEVQFPRMFRQGLLRAARRRERAAGGGPEPISAPHRSPPVPVSGPGGGSAASLV